MERRWIGRRGQGRSQEPYRLWFGWSGVISDAPDPEPKIIEKNKTTFAVIDLSTADFQEYYNGLANRVLWPTLHYQVDLAEYSKAGLDGYLRVNRNFAECISRMLKPDDQIWVHDYHLMPLARELRARGHENQIGFFLHIPCPPPDILFTLPKHDKSLGALIDYDLVDSKPTTTATILGVIWHCRVELVSREGTIYNIKGRTVRIGAFPVGIETAVFARLARNAGGSAFTKEFRDSLAGTRLVVGVDRLDYSKGLRVRLDGFNAFLAKEPDWRGRVTFLQITPTSRSDIKDYAEIDRVVGEQVGHINGRYGEHRGRQFDMSTEPTRVRLCLESTGRRTWRL